VRHVHAQQHYQVRSLGAEAANYAGRVRIFSFDFLVIFFFVISIKLDQLRAAAAMNFFAVDFNEEFSAMDGYWQQAFHTIYFLFTVVFLLLLFLFLIPFLSLIIVLLIFIYLSLYGILEINCVNRQSL
jgi:hypothetical protein